MKWPLEKLEQPMFTRNADRTDNAVGKIKHQVTLHLEINRRSMKQHFFVLSLGKRNIIILSYLWLTRCNP